ncbi:MAG: HAD family hydrolase [Deltaproteobacteria bacterium]|nr:HAD family hydrolase [Deltaproteobacteria bacterium]
MKTLLLDLDGTLLGSRKRLHVSFVWGTLWWLARRRVGPVKALRALHELRMGIENHEPGILNSRRAARRFARVLGVDDERGYELAVRLTNDVFPGLERCFFPIAEAQEFIGWAQQRYPLILATNAVWPRPIVELRVRWAGLDPGIFRFIANNDVMHHVKPSVEYYQELIDLLKLTPGEALMIGDSVRKDLPARKAGIPVFLLSRESEPVEVEDRVWRGDFGALKKLLEKK